ncbi:Lipid transport protein N-terminal [Trinorchestia longiramus]|nr:Lipid transport protein N-terminal [Trinorchestia longiramus]
MELFSCTLLLLTAGTAVGLQYPLSYQYRYKASVTGVLPDVSTQQHALASIDTTVTVDTVSSNTVIVQFRDTFVNEHHGKVECGGHQPDASQRIHASIREAFEAPFQVTYDFNKKPRLEVPSTEPLWISNVRRGLVNLLLVVPTTEHLLKRSYTNTRTNTLDSDTSISPLDPTSFTRMEDTIYGTCQVHYSLTSAPVSARTQHPVPRRDIQRSAGKSSDGSWPQISDHLYVLQRSTDLNHCHHRPLMFASTNTEGNNNHTASSDDRFFTQSSLGRLIVRGENDPRRSQNMRLEFAQVEAGAVMKPLGVHGGQIHVLTNQTLELEMTYKKRTSGLLENLVLLQSIKFEMTSPFSPPSSSEASSWVRYAATQNDPLAPVYPQEFLLGYHANATGTQYLKERLLQEASSAATALQTLQAVHSSSGSKTHQDVPGGALMASDVGERLVALMEGIRGLKKEDLLDIDKVVGAKHGDLAKQIYHEALAASGAPAAAAMVLDDLLGHSGGHLLDSLASLATVASAARSPVSATQLMNFLQTLADKTSPAGGGDRVLMLSALLTTATTIRRLCASDNRPFYGGQFDDNCEVEAELLRFIRHQMQATTTSTEKVVFLRALGYLKTEAALQDLIKLVKSNRAEVRTRIAAVFSLTPSHTASSARNLVFESLDLVMTSQTQAPELRQAAAMVLLLWHPDQMWWLR